MSPPAPAYVWPWTLRLPARPPKVVYLDLNHWIALAKANTGKPDGDPYRETLNACVDAADRRTAVFPISDSIYIEINKIGQHRQRRDLREVIERVSGFMVVTSRSVISAHEIEAMLDVRFWPSRDPVNEMSYLDWGVARAFGMHGGLAIRDRETGEDVTDEVRAKHPGGPKEFDRLIWVSQVGLNRDVLDGPAPEDEPELRALGWDPSGAFEIANRRAQQEIDQVARFDEDPSWRRGRIRDVVAAREVLIEINQHLWKGLADRELDLQRAFPELDDARAAFDSMPSFDVAVTMKTEYHRDSGHRWTPNDIHDIDALGSTIPYCDIVVIDKAAASHAVRTGLAERLGTTVLARTADLPSHL